MEPARGLVAGWLHAGVRAASEALFPENDLGAPDFRDTEMERRTLEYIDELPPDQRRLLVALFVFVELCAGLLVPRFRRFSRVPPGQRAWAVRRWRRSRFFVLRVLGDALKATTTMMYLSHPLVIAHIGEYRTCPGTADDPAFPVRADALPLSTVSE